MNSCRAPWKNLICTKYMCHFFLFCQTCHREKFEMQVRCWPGGKIKEPASVDVGGKEESRKSPQGLFRKSCQAESKARAGTGVPRTGGAHSWWDTCGMGTGAMCPSSPVLPLLAEGVSLPSTTLDPFLMLSPGSFSVPQRKPEDVG